MGIFIAYDINTRLKMQSTIEFIHYGDYTLNINARTKMMKMHISGEAVDSQKVIRWII
jgi:hypothetical protein